MDIGKRIFRLIQSYSQEELAAFQKKVFDKGIDLEEELDSFEKTKAQKQTTSQNQSQADSRPAQNSGYSQELVEDLAVFGLQPPATFEEIKKARNKEIKAYHPDRFASDPKKEEAAKKILQLYNAAFERLKKKLG